MLHFSTPKISLLGTPLNNAQIFEVKDEFYAVVDDPLDSAVERCT